MTHKQSMQKLKKLHLVSPQNVPVTFPAFKNRAMVHTFSDGRKGVFLGIPNTSMFGFYATGNSDMDLMRDAYAMYLRLVKNEMFDEDEKLIQWGIKIPSRLGKMPQK